MQFGLCTTYDPAALRLCKDSGADFVELNFTALASLTPEEIDGVRRRLDDLALPCLSCNCMFPGDRIRLTGARRDMDAARAYLNAAFDRLAPLGVRHVVFGSAGARSTEPGGDTAQAFAELAGFLREVAAPALRAHGWVCSIEPLSECNLIRTTTDGRRLMDAVAQPEVRLLADFYHVYATGEDPRDTAACVPFLRHVHTAARHGRFFPTGADMDDCLSMLRMLKDGGYSGCVSVEAIPRPEADPLGERREALRVLREAEARL